METGIYEVTNKRNLIKHTKRKEKKVKLQIYDHVSFSRHLFINSKLY